MRDELIEALETQPSLLDAAIDIAKRYKWAVFPAKGKRPASAGWQATATHEAEALSKQWNASYNVALATGLQPSGDSILVIDTEESFEPASLPHPLPEDTLIALTGGNGRHYYFSVDMPDWDVVQNTVQQLAPHCDSRFTGGLVILPPSIHPDTGQPYRWLNNNPVQPAPKWLIDMFRNLKPATVPSFAGNGEQLRIPHGTRDVYVYKQLCKHRAMGFSDQQIAEFASTLNKACDPPLTERELQTKIKQACKHKPGTFVPKDEYVSTVKTLNPRSEKHDKTDKALVSFSQMSLSTLTITPPEWLWDGFIAKGYITLLSADPKCGKTTLVAHVLAQSYKGKDFWLPIRKDIRAIWITEESGSIWADRLLSLDLQQNQITRAETKHKPTWEQFNSIVQAIADKVSSDHIDMVIWDTISRLSPIQREQDAVEWQRMFAALAPLKATGCAILCLHHNNKDKESTGMARSRGSSELLGETDINLSLSRKEEVSVLKRAGRGVEPGEFQYTYSTAGDHDVLTPFEHSIPLTRLTLLSQLMPLLPATIEDLANKTHHARSSIKRAMEAGELIAHTIRRSGNGTKSEPYVFHAVSPSVDITAPVDLPEPEPEVKPQQDKPEPVGVPTFSDLCVSLQGVLSQADSDTATATATINDTLDIWDMGSGDQNYGYYN